MRILFVRHAEAVDTEKFSGPDLDRPLTRAGVRSARAAFNALVGYISKPELVITSEAVRAKQTGDILAKAFGIRRKRASAMLNPGCRIGAFRSLLSGLPGGLQAVAVVGHEPDLSGLISNIVANGRLRMKIKNGACIEVEMDEQCRGSLKFSVSPELLA